MTHRTGNLAIRGFASLPDVDFEPGHGWRRFDWLPPARRGGGTPGDRPPVRLPLDGLPPEPSAPTGSVQVPALLVSRSPLDRAVKELLDVSEDTTSLPPDLPLRSCGCILCSADPYAAASDLLPPPNGVPPLPIRDVGPPASLQALADYLRVGFWQEWGDITRRYNLTDSGTNPNRGVLLYNTSGWSQDADGLVAARRTLVREVFKLYEAVLGIDFVETTATDTTVDIFFSDNGSGAYTSMVGSSLGVDYSIININAGWAGGASSYDSFTVRTIFHEIGHALGLGHQGLYNGGGGYSISSNFANDSWLVSMMSYWSQTDNPTTGASYAFLQTPMSVDWLALNDIYGSQIYGSKRFGVANAFLGDTVYGVGTNISSDISDIWNKYSEFGDTTAYTLVDGGGYDTLDVSNFAVDQVINLAPSQAGALAPSVSNIGGKIGNLTIAVGTIIEAANGGIGNDVFYGNTASNAFRGGAGNDRFYDSAGSDIYFGDSGDDWLYFTESLDFLSYTYDGQSLLFASGTGDVDRVWGDIENLSFNFTAYTYQQLLEVLPPPGLPMASIQIANGTLTNGAATRETDLLFTGSLSQPLAAGQAVAFYRNNVAMGYGTPLQDGSTGWTFQLQEPSGTSEVISYSAQVMEVGSGRVGPASGTFALTVDTVAPLVGVDPLSTEDTTPSLTGGVDDPQATVTVTIGGITRTAVNQGNGRWSLEWSEPLAADRTYDVIASARDAVGNTATDATSAELTVRSAATAPALPPTLYFSLASDITASTPSILGGLTPKRNDIVAFDGTNFSIWFNGDANGLGGLALRDFDVVGPDQILFVLDKPATINGVSFADSDVGRLRRGPTGFTAEMVLNGSDVGLSRRDEAIDAITGLPDGSFLVSTRGGLSVGWFTAAAEDLVRFTPTSLGANTAGAWSMYADMSDVRLSVNVVGADVASDGRIFLATGSGFSVAGLTGANEDVFAFLPTSLGANTAGSFQTALRFDGSAYGLAANALLGIDVPG